MSSLATAPCPSCRQANYIYEPTCKACGGELTAWQSLSPEEQKRYTCWKCGGRYTLTQQNSGNSTGVVLIVVGLLLTPVLIGIVLIIVGVGQLNQTQSYWQCRSCGLTLPA